MDFFRGAESLMRMDDAAWRRHASLMSGWTRLLTVLPLLVPAIWSRVRIGCWAWGAMGTAVLWVWGNPRAFPEPHRLDSWMSRGVLGERIFLEHRNKIDSHHLKLANVMTALSLPGALVVVRGFYALWWEGAVFGAVLTALPKVWFVDRMVWLQGDWVPRGNAVPGMEDRCV